MPNSQRAKPRRDPWADAVAHLRQAHPAFGPLIERVGPCALRPKKERFGILVRAIIGQQISSKAAASIDARLRAAAGDPHHPDALVGFGESGLRSVGISGVKARYILSLATSVQSGAVPLHKFGRWSDEAIIANLTTVKGIGVWTAEMFLIFALNRPDVLPVADLGIRVGLKNLFDLPEQPSPALCRELTESWRPYRTAAMWYIWRSLDNETKPKPKP